MSSIEPGVSICRIEPTTLEVLATLLEWQAAGHSCWLLTVAGTWGASPRPPGSLAGVRADGCIVGSVSGGCVEDDLATCAREGRLPESGIEAIRYGAGVAGLRGRALPCGSTLEVAVEPLGRASRWLHPAVTALRERRHFVRHLDLACGTAAFSLERAAATFARDGDRLQAGYGPQHRLLIIGANEVARALCHIAGVLDFDITVCDPRDEYALVWHEAIAPLSRDMPDDFVLAMRVDASTAIVALAHDPKLDDMALLEALKTSAFYVGAVGSRLSSVKRRERLALFDLTAQHLARLVAPVGLAIGSSTPAEIAVSIAADLVSRLHAAPADCGASPARACRLA